MGRKLQGLCCYCGKEVVIDGSANNHYSKSKRKTYTFFHKDCYNAYNVRYDNEFLMDWIEDINND